MPATWTAPYATTEKSLAFLHFSVLFAQAMFELLKLSAVYHLQTKNSHPVQNPPKLNASTEDKKSRLPNHLFHSKAQCRRDCYSRQAPRDAKAFKQGAQLLI